MAGILCIAGEPQPNRWVYLARKWGLGKSGKLAMSNLASDAITLNTMVARFNVERFRNILAGEIEETKRQTLLQLVAEETAKLAALSRADLFRSAIGQPA
jgi:hypothetical protein